MRTPARTLRAILKLRSTGPPRVWRRSEDNGYASAQSGGFGIAKSIAIMLAAIAGNTTKSWKKLAKFAGVTVQCERVSKPPPSATRPPLRRGNVVISRALMGQGANEYNAQSANSEGKSGTITGTFGPRPFQSDRAGRRRLKTRPCFSTISCQYVRNGMQQISYLAAS
jgi:hypothetical protein